MSHYEVDHKHVMCGSHGLSLITLQVISHIAILVQFKVAKLELISKSRHPLFHLVTFLCWSHILTLAYISKVKFSQAPSPWG